MPWVKLDDRFFTHPKVVRCPPEARLLYLAGLTWAAANLTDGHLPTEVLPLLAGLAGLDQANTKQIASCLLDVGLWHACEDDRGGYLIHDYLDYNPSREQTLKTRLARAEAGRKGGKASTKQRASNLLSNEPANSQANGEQKTSKSLPRTRTPFNSLEPKGSREPSPSLSPEPPPPIIEIWAQTTGRAPRKETWPLIAEALGSVPEERAREALASAFSRWAAHDFKPTNVAGILEWTLETLAGRQPRPQGSQNGAPLEPAGLRALRGLGLEIPEPEEPTDQ